MSARALESAMLKHDECAAAMSSSGVVVVSEPSLRAFQLIGKVPRFEEEKATLPDPSIREPFQVVVASLVTGMVPPRFVAGCAASLSTRSPVGNLRLRQQPLCR